MFWRIKDSQLSKQVLDCESHVSLKVLFYLQHSYVGIKFSFSL